MEYGSNGGIDQLSQTSDDIGPVDSSSEEAVSSLTPQYHKRYNNNYDKSEKIEISRPNSAVDEDQTQPLTGIR